MGHTYYSNERDLTVLLRLKIFRWACMLGNEIGIEWNGMSMYAWL